MTRAAARAAAACATLALACAAIVIAALPATALAESPPALSVASAAMYAPATGQLLYGVHPDRERPIASTTKLMTALIVLQHVHRLSRVFTYPDYDQAPSDSQIGLRPGDRMTVHDLLVAMLLPSADDAAEDLAYNVGHRSVTRFVAMMNAEARTLGLKHTHYSTPIGLDTPGNYSSASDLVKLADYDLTHSAFFARTVARTGARLATGPVRYVTNLNTLVATVPWIDGVKTGHTDGAGYVLVASGHKDGMALISAVLGTDSETARNTETMALLDYGYGNFRPWTPVVAGRVLARPAVKDRHGVHVPVIASRSFTRVLPRAAHVHVDVRVPRRLAGPLPGRSVVGSAVVSRDGHVIARIPLLLSRTLTAVSGLTLAARLFTKPLVVAAIAVVLALAAILVFTALRRRRSRSGDGGPGPDEADSGWETA